MAEYSVCGGGGGGNEMNASPRIVYLARFSFRFERTIHKFTNKEQLRNFIDQKSLKKN